MCCCIDYISKHKMLVLNIFVYSECRLPLFICWSTTLSGGGERGGFGALRKISLALSIVILTLEHDKEPLFMSLKWKQLKLIQCIALVIIFGSLKLSLAALAGLLIKGKGENIPVLFILRKYFDHSLKWNKLSTFHSTGTGFDIATLTLVAWDKRCI